MGEGGGRRDGRKNWSKLLLLLQVQKGGGGDRGGAYPGPTLPAHGMSAVLLSSRLTTNARSHYAVAIAAPRAHVRCDFSYALDMVCGIWVITAIYALLSTDYAVQPLLREPHSTIGQTPTS
ncbi:hypothetical protein K461DRAFT_277755 [Myriangium duriaei CBS 260.36]|uniref:Uncharacterized protein n=1 Tax=Myriangium duriaei CBS 260.36 TaxID=1168546 RepID=A0A9P4MHB0_9PEZI|nr:hypothetical protein K461DRAFT_277755 [Myriangium duriaei CBS 260.36]